LVTRKSLGRPLRTLKNALSDQFLALEQAGVPKEELELFDRGRMYLGLVEGDTEDGSLLAGQIAGMIKDIKPVKAIIEEITAEAERIISGLNSFCREG